MKVREFFELYNAAIEGKTIICSTTEHYSGYDSSWSRTYDNEVDFLNLELEDLVSSNDDPNEEYGFSYKYSYHILKGVKK